MNQEQDAIKGVKRMLQAVFLVQLASFLCLCVLKYNIDIFSVNYTQMESKASRADLLLEQISSTVYCHEALVYRYVTLDSTEQMDAYERDEAALREETEALLEELEPVARELKGQKQYDITREAIEEYLTWAEMVLDTRRNVSQEMAINMVNDNMADYVGNANELMDLIQVTAEANVEAANVRLLQLTMNTRVSFFIGAALIIISSVICLTYLHRMMQNQLKYMQQAQAASKAKSIFLSNMSHEIRTPINAIIGLNEMIQRNASDDQVLNYSRKVESSSRSLLKIINDILDFSKIEAGKMELNEEDYSLADLLTSTYDMVIGRAREKGLSLSYQVDPEIPGTLRGDQVRIKQLLINLLTNGIKYTKSGGVEVTISYKVAAEDRIRLRVTVKDTGMGIKPEDIGSLTKAFERVNVAETRHIQGTGLGLAIVSSILEVMDSKLEISSVPDQGSTFAFEIFQAVVDTAPIGRYDPELYEEAVPVVVERTEQQFTARGVHILAVDDNDINRMVIQELLKRTQVQLDLAEGGQEAIDICQTRTYDLIIMDHRMPNVDGVEALKGIRRSGQNTQTPVIVATANADDEMADYYRSEGFAGFLKKPIEARELERMLAEFLPTDLVETAEQAAQEDHLQEMVAVKFVETAHHIRQELLTLQLAGNIEDYTIKVHALKSSARMAGALKLSEAARQLEESGTQQDAEAVNAGTPALLALFDKSVEELRRKYNITDGEPAKPFDKTRTLELLDTILAANEELDFDTIDKAVEELAGYDLPDDLTEDMAKLKDAAFNLAQEQIVEQVQRLQALVNKE